MGAADNTSKHYLFLYFHRHHVAAETLRSISTL